MSLTLHRVYVPSPEDEYGEHIFLFSLDNVPKFDREIKSVEGEEFYFGGNSWSLVCARKEEAHLGVFIKWRYPDPNSASMVSVKTKFSISVIHQHRQSDNVTFSSSSQKFTISQPLLGKSKMLTINDFLDLTKGYLDVTGRQAMIELKMVGCTTRFETTVDVSPKNRTKKNASGVYFDTTSFLLSTHRWFLRFYIKKVNSNSLPAVYLYMLGGHGGVSINLQFTLFLRTDSTEILRYDFGEGAKFDGFGKTLSDQFANPDKLVELNVAVEIVQVTVYKLLFLNLPTMYSSTNYVQNQKHSRKSPLFFSKPSPRAQSREKVSNPVYKTNDSSQQVFQDHLGNLWKVEFSRNTNGEHSTAVVFEKGVYHYQNNKTKIACIQAYIMSQDLDVAQDILMTNPLVVCYFSNSSDDKGYPITFPVSLQQLAGEKCGYSNENREILLRIDFVSVQTTPFSVRSGPKFDYLMNHLLQNREGVENGERSLCSVRETCASRASLSLLDERPPSDSSCSSGLGLLTAKSGSESPYRTKSSESLLSSIHSEVGGTQFNKTLPSNSFLLEFLQSLAASGQNQDTDQGFVTSRTKLMAENFKESRRLTNFNPNICDEMTLIRQANCNVKDELRQKELIDNLVKFLEQKFPLHVSEIVLLGSHGSGTSTSNRCDVDIIIFSPELPRVNHKAWAPPLLSTLRKLLEQASIFETLFSSLNCTSFATTCYSIQFRCDDFLDVDIWISHDWSKENETDESAFVLDGKCYRGDICNPLYEATKKCSKDFRFFEMCSSQIKKIFFNELTAEVKDYIKVVKYWRNSIVWDKTEYRPDSCLLSLLVIRASELVNENSLVKVLQTIWQLVTEPELRLSWQRFYDDFTARKFTFDPPTPLIQDPTNPAINVASQLKYWGQFKTEYLKWMDQLKIKLLFIS